MVFHYDYSAYKKCFTLEWYKNNHVHYPLYMDPKTIENIFKTKKKLMNLSLE